MAVDFLGKGWRFPVQVDANGQIRISEGEENIQDSIRLILRTHKGERIFQPDFGCGIHDYVFSAVNAATIALIENSVKEALTLWEPRIILLKVSASTERLNEGQFLIEIDYQVRSTNNRFNLVYPFYLNEGR